MASWYTHYGMLYKWCLKMTSAVQYTSKYISTIYKAKYTIWFLDQFWLSRKNVSALWFIKSLWLKKCIQSSFSFCRLCGFRFNKIMLNAFAHYFKETHTQWTNLVYEIWRILCFQWGILYELEVTKNICIGVLIGLKASKLSHN